MERTLRTSLAEVAEAVREATAYTGAKMPAQDQQTFERIAAAEADSGILDRFRAELRAALCKELIGIVAGERETSGGDYELRLEVSAKFDDALLESMNASLKSYFIQGIQAKWYTYTNKGEAGDYATKAQAALEDIHRKALHKKKPERPVY